MRQTSIFLSSTCYDLRSMREHIRSEIATWGHNPILSEYPSFPVSPDLTTVENCKKVVRECADVFVLIIGGRRGSLDPTTQKSVVNSEFQEAIHNGLDCFVFVDKQVMDLIPHFNRNPDSDFSHTVDNPQVFKFIDEVNKQTKWIFTFTRTEEILTILRLQLSIRLQSLISMRRSNVISVPYEFSSEPAQIAHIARDKGPFWEYRLTGEIIKHRMKAIDRKFADLDGGFIVKALTPLKPNETFSYITSRLSDMTAIFNAVLKVLQLQITPAFGPPGIPGDAVEIKRSCENLIQLVESLYEWECNIRFVKPHDLFKPVFKIMQGWTVELVPEFHRIPNELDKILSTPNPTGEYLIDLQIKAPSGLKDFEAELQRMQSEPRIIELMFYNG